jgi:hypothetical protein
VTSVKKRTLSLEQLNLELAKLERKQKAAELGIGAGLGAVAAVLIVYGIEDPVPRSRIARTSQCGTCARPRLRRRRKRSTKPLAPFRRSRAMSEKPGVENIRAEIAAERQRLDDDLNALKSELRSLVPLAGAGLAVVALVTFRKSARAGLRTLWRLV